MNVFIVLLRGVMPTGKNRVPMADLRRVLSADADFENVQTWIQSGNVALKTALSAQETAERVRQHIQTHIGAELKIIVKTPPEIETVLRNNPFGENHDISRVFFTLFNDVPDAERVAALQSQDFGENRCAITPHAVYLFVPQSFAKTKLNNNFLERKLKIDATTRNFNTLWKMVELAKQ